jgi:hypothetical protein
MIISVTGIIFLRNIKTSIVVMVTRVFFAVRTEFILFRRTPSSEGYVVESLLFEEPQ